VHKFDATEKQKLFIETVFRKDIRFAAYGGAAGGGKTFGSLAVLILLCKFYPGSRWGVIRKSLTEIKLNTLPSFFKLCPSNFLKDYNKSEHYVTFTNGSQIIFKGENIHDDPELQWMDGLEVNGFLLEQVEELSYKTFDKCKLRAGRWIMPVMPPIKIMMTLNPSQNWTKETIYKPYSIGELLPPFAYIPAGIMDNPNLPAEYVEGLKLLDPITYKRFVEGDWSAFAVDKPFAYCFKETKHVGSVEFNPEHELRISFDFNVDPITAVASQQIGNQIRFIKEFRLNNSNIYELCDQVKATYPFAVLNVTGDATGRSRSALTTGNINYYTVIKEKLYLTDGQMNVPTINPAHSDSRVLCNSILSNFDLVIDKSCRFLIEDLTYVEVTPEGKIDKTKDKFRSHLLDCFLYTLNTFHSHLLKIQFHELTTQIPN
jgi:hypothetical protein